MVGEQGDINTDPRPTLTGKYSEVKQLRDIVYYNEAFELIWSGLINQTELLGIDGLGDKLKAGRLEAEAAHSPLSKDEERKLHNETLSNYNKVNRIFGHEAEPELKDFSRLVLNRTAGRNFALQTLNTALRQSIQIANGNLKLSSAEGETQAIIKHLTGLVQKAVRYSQTTDQLAAQSHSLASRIFGADIEKAEPIWEALLLLRTSNIKQKHSPIGGIYRKAIDLLTNRQYDQARFFLEELAAQNPDILPDFALKELRIEPEALREILENTPVSQGGAKGEGKSHDRELREKFLKMDGVILSSSTGDARLRIRAVPPGAIYVTFLGNVSKDTVGLKGVSTRPRDLEALIELFELKPES